MIINCAKFYLNYFKNIKNFKICNAINFLKSFHHHQILCAINHSIFGVEKINYYIEQILIQDGLIQLTTSKNYLGRPIIILKNEYSLKLFNGDIGILLLNSEKNLSAYFLDSNNTVKIVPLYQLPKHETCFAMTIHKSQGSEFKNVTIILPNQYCSILTRELLYSAITRSRQNLFIYAKNNIIKKTIKNKIKRYSGLPNKINTYMKNSLLKIKNK